jgi:hypothetical protein
MTAPVELEEGLYAYLTAQPNIAAYVSGRVYHVEMPQNPTYPCITFQRFATPEVVYAMGGPCGFVTALIQLDCWAEKRKTARQLAIQVRLALSGFRGTFTAPAGSLRISLITKDEEQDMPKEPDEQGLGIGRVMQEYSISFFEDVP